MAQRNSPGGSTQETSSATSRQGDTLFHWLFGIAIASLGMSTKLLYIEPG